MFNIFKKKGAENTQNSSNVITADRLVSIEGYVPNPSEKKYNIVKTDDVSIFKAFNPENVKTAARALYAIGRVQETPENKEFILKYGERVILVSNKFMKLRKKTQLRFIEKICFEVAGVPSRFIRGMNSIESTNIDRKVAAELQMMEKYGYGPVKRLIKKEQKLNLLLMKSAGKYLYKSAKKAEKLAKKNNKTSVQDASNEVLQKPIIFKNVEPSAQ